MEAKLAEKNGGYNYTSTKTTVPEKGRENKEGDIKLSAKRGGQGGRTSDEVGTTQCKASRQERPTVPEGDRRRR